jgi:type II secretory pathway component PulF
LKQKNKRPTGIEFATLAEQFGDLMEIGESPTQVCRLLSYAQTNKILSDALMSAGELVMNGWTISEAFAAQRDAKGEPLFPITFICALRIGEEVGTTTDIDSGETKVLSAHAETICGGREEGRQHSLQHPQRDDVSGRRHPVLLCCGRHRALFRDAQDGRALHVAADGPGRSASVHHANHDRRVGLSYELVGPWVRDHLAIAVLYFARWSQTPAGSDSLKVFSLRVPVFGSFFRHYYAAQTLRTLAMLASGIPSMTERFLVAAETSTNPEYAQMLMHVRHRFMTESTDLHKLFVPYPFLMGKEFAGVLLTFEKTADMQNTFHNYAKVVETRAERELEKVLFWFQNFAIVPVGIFVGFIVAALYSPMFELAGRIGSK